MDSGRRLTFLDRCIGAVDQLVRGACRVRGHTASRVNPAAPQTTETLSARERALSARLMRVNHAGEMAAQALYQGQGLTARGISVRNSMGESAAQEIDHLAWCEQRLQELDGPTSRLDPFWYLGSFIIGALAGAAGDRFSLGFVAETERQVVDHLEGHLSRLPADDHRSHALLVQMKADEAHHGATATRAGGRLPPAPVRVLMRLGSKLMTETSYWI